MLITAYKFDLFENFVMENFRHLSKISPLFVDKVFPNWAWEKDDKKNGA